MKKVTLIFAGLLVAVTTIPVMAGPGRHHNMGIMIRQCFHKAGVQLTPDQRDKMRTLRDEMRLQRDKFRPEMRKIKKTMLKAFANPEVSDARVRELMIQNRKLMRPVMSKFLKIRHILTKEQLKKIANTPDCLEPGMGRGGMGPGHKGMRHGRGRKGRGMGCGGMDCGMGR